MEQHFAYVVSYWQQAGPQSQALLGAQGFVFWGALWLASTLFGGLVREVLHCKATTPTFMHPAERYSGGQSRAEQL